jgi:sugar phosphate isomerase/epimerase
MKTARIAECEIMSGHVEPMGSYATGWWVAMRRDPGFPKMREDARRWRLSVPMEYYRKVRRQFEQAGLSIFLYNVNFNETFTDAERDRTCEAAKELGAAGFSSSTVISEARRLVPFVEPHKMFVAMHNHNNLVDPDQFATSASFEKALGMSEYFKATLDIGHFTAGNNDAVDFIAKHHDRIVNIHVRDGKRNNGRNMPFGHGDTPIKEVLRLIRDNRYPIRCYIEYEYGSFLSSTEEVKRCLEYCKQVLA